MARPTLRVLTSGIAAWDADVDANFQIIAGGPFPIYNPADTTTLNSEAPAASYDNCLALVGTTSVLLYISNGSTWEVYRQGDAVADSTASTVADLASDFNDLLASLKDAGIMATA